MIVGCYSLDLYCDNTARDNDVFPDSAGNTVILHTRAWEYTGKTGGQARQAARRDGWHLNLQTGIAICPHCKKQKGK